MSINPDDLDVGTTRRGLRTPQKLIHQRYSLGRLLGRGNLSVVWQARDLELGTDVALKFIPTAILRDPFALDALRREIRRARSLTHPHIVRVHDFIIEDDAAAVVMEYVPGETLIERLAQRPHRIFSPAQLGPWLVQICSALSYAHDQADVLHRDLRPSNLLIDSRARVRITDFGVSRCLIESHARLSPRLTGDETLPYLSPNLLAGGVPTVADDIYSLGATLYTLLTGQVPLPTGDLADRMHQFPGGGLPTVAARRRELGVPIEAGSLSPVWESTLAACLSPDPAHRPATATAIGQALGLVFHNVAASLPPPPSFLIPEPPTLSPRRRFEDFSIMPHLPKIACVLAILGGLFYTKIHRPEQKRLAAIAAAAAEAEAYETALRNARPGSIVVETTPPGAMVTVGKFPGGPSPLIIREAPGGRYPVTVHLAGYDDHRAEAIMAGEKGTVLRLVLVRSTGGLKIDAHPGAQYRLDGADGLRRTGTCPATETGLPTGDYRLTIFRNKYPAVTRSFTVTPGPVTDATVAFAGAGLELTAIPAGAIVRDGFGREVGRAPLSYSALPPGKITLTVFYYGLTYQRFDVNLRAGETTRLDAKLVSHTFPTGTAAYENTLGMRFAPAGTPGVLFSIWETREQDYEEFVRLARWTWTTVKTGSKHPVVSIGHEDARAFCEWLTRKERAEGKLWPDQRYRLPTDHEWSVAIGLNEDPELDPEKKQTLSPNHYPWGFTWPPPHGAGNYGPELQRDSYRGLAPVGSFRAYAYGLHDMGGNVSEWVCGMEVPEDKRYGGVYYELRGASYKTTYPAALLSANRGDTTRASGFRAVLEVGAGSTSLQPEIPAPPSP